MASSNPPSAAQTVDHVPVDDDGPGAIAVADTGERSEGGKLKMILQLLRKCLGVTDIATMRLSLPSSLLDPIPNLDYYHYLDRPDLFIAINDSDDEFERMLAVLRFTFAKDLKFVHGKVCKPYNSVLGEHFRSHWDVTPVVYSDEPFQPPICSAYTSTPAPPSTTSRLGVDSIGGPSSHSRSETASIKSGKSSKSTRSAFSLLSKSPSTAATSLQFTEQNIAAGISNLSLGDPYPTANGDADADGGNSSGSDDDPARVRVVYVTEQVSHHPPVSAYYGTCPSRHIEMSGIDHMSARVSGPTVRVISGSFNKGIFIRMTGGPGEGETYHITHPVAIISGILMGKFYMAVGGSTIITCEGGKGGNGGAKLRTILEYKEDSWLGRPHFLIEGVIHTYTPGASEHEDWTKVKHVPSSRIVASFEGSWRHLVKWRRHAPSAPTSARSSNASSRPSSSLSSTPATATATAPPSRSNLDLTTSTPTPLLDLSTLRAIPKVVRPLDRQLPHESRRMWEPVTTPLVKKEFGEATKQKLAIEQKQRDAAAERRRKGIPYIPRYFEKDISSGMPVLTAEGLAAVKEELAEPSDYDIEGPGKEAKLGP